MTAPAPSPGVVSLAEAAALARQARARGERVVLANGCFDLLHVGHVRYLEGARALGDRLLVAVNADRSVRALKGEGRPVLGEAARAELVAALASVDAAFVFDAPDVHAVLRELRPHVHAKGTDYTPDTVPERGTAAELGIEVRIAGDPKDHSTRALLERIAPPRAAGETPGEP